MPISKLIVEIPDGLKKKFKKVCWEQRVTQRLIVIKQLEKWIKEQEDKNV
jgi:hypothetical protein